ncbi:hypothetical protein LARI1_G008039 [Lachnellula arida]|uniref:DUF7371 domain-containing protein n=1 Tax=Lachnellula arida TaxID=1316785 RepID=A0A8T9B0N5_9HELO|nr:hypothetical protein LARI1_G008039 [Lachnellula arida]
MRNQALSTLAGVWCVAAIAAAAPSPNLDAADTCAPSISTVFLTAAPSTSTSTVTVHDVSSISTVYITEHTTVQVSEVSNPTSTLTAISTFYTTTTASETRTIPTSDNDQGAAVASDTATEHTVATAPYGQTSSSPEVISYYVESGITKYLDGQTPNPSDSTVYLTGVVTVTVEPIYTASSVVLSSSTVESIHTAPGIVVSSSSVESIHTAPGIVVSSSSVESIHTAPGIVVSSSSVEPTTTVYAHTTITTSVETTLADTLSAKSTYSAGSSLSFTGIGAGGWNKSSTASIVSGATGATGTVASQSGLGVTSLSSLSLVISSSYDIYSPHSVSQLTSLAAASGFQTTPAIATPVYASTDADVSASAIGGQDTSLSHSSVKAYTTSNLSSTNGGASAPTPYGNSTISSSSPTANGSASGVYTSPASVSFSTVYTSAPIGLNSTSSISTVSTKSSIGLVSTTGSSNTSVVLPYSVRRSSSTFSSSATAALNATSTVTSSLSQSSSQISSSASKSSNVTSVASSATQSTSQISSSTFATSNATSTAASAAPTNTSSCGLTGDFTLNFDDLPPLVVGKGIDPNTIQPMPLFNPYDKFDFSNGFSVVPPPTDPYLPESAPFLLQFVPNFNVSGTDANGPHGPNTKELGYSADFAGADGGATGCFNFNFYGAALGCDSRGPDCEFTFTGFHKDSATGTDVPFTTQDIDVPACPPLDDCVLTPVTLDDTFSNLTKVRMNVTVASQPKIWWMDDVRLGWFDNSCDKGKCRYDTHVR